MPGFFCQLNIFMVLDLLQFYFRLVAVWVYYDVFESLPIRINILPLLSDVFTSGYPLAIDHNNGINLISRRALKGYIVHAGKNINHSNNTECYELSFYCPPGISGAPLFYTEEDNLIYIQGIIVGVSRSENPITQIKEIENVIYEKIETTFYGVAINALSIIDMKSELLSKSIKEYLIEENLLNKNN